MVTSFRNKLHQSKENPSVEVVRDQQKHQGTNQNKRLDKAYME